jgi:hypothetical protein
MKQDDKNEKDYLKDLAPNLFREELEKERQVPDGYFDHLEDEVFAKVREDHSDLPLGKWRSVINYRNLAIAAGVALLVALGPLLWKAGDESTTESGVSWEAIDGEEASLYLAEEYEVEDWLYSEVGEDELERITLADGEISDEAIIDYLLESDVSESLILESL